MSVSQVLYVISKGNSLNIAHEDVAAGSGDEDEEHVDANEEEEVGPQAFSPKRDESRRGHRIPPLRNTPAL
jgi:hypothetical protein